MKKTVAALLAVTLMLTLCAACGSKVASAAEAVPVPEAAPNAVFPDPPVNGIPSGEPSGGLSSEPSGEPVAELYPADGYDKDLKGYKTYAIDALAQDEHAPADIVEMTVEGIKAAETGDDSVFSMLIRQGLILSYDEFMAE